MNFEDIGFGGISLDFSQQINRLADLPTPPSRWDLAAEAASQRDEQTELLAKLIERQDAMIEEQKRQAEEQSAAAKSGKMREIVVIILTALTLTATVVFGVITTLSVP